MGSSKHHRSGCWLVLRRAVKGLLFSSAVLGLTLGAGASLAAGVPQMLPYAGTVMVHGDPFTGDGAFKFALIDGAGVAYWFNDGSPLNGIAPRNAVVLPTHQGRFEVILGDVTLANMGLIPDLFDRSDLYLRVWFNDGINGFQMLSPDRPLASVPYAYRAAVADTVMGNGVIGARQIADRAITADKIDLTTLNMAPANHVHSHGTLTGVGPADHHSRYTDAEAQAAISGGDLTLMGTVSASNFIGNASGLTGLTAPGNLTNADHTYIDADDNADGIGEIRLSIAGRPGLLLQNDGRAGFGTAAPAARLHAVDRLVSALSGTVSTLARDARVTGVGTLFLSQVQVGDAVGIGNQRFTVTGVTHDLEMVVSPTPQANVSQVPMLVGGDLLRLDDVAGNARLTVSRSGVVQATGFSGDGAGLTGVGNVAIDSIGSQNIRNGSIGAADIAANAVGSAQISRNAVGTEEIALAAVTTAQLARGAVNSEKLADGSVNTTEIANFSILGQDLANNIISEFKIRDAAVTRTKIAANAVDSIRLATTSHTVVGPPGGAQSSMTLPGKFACRLVIGPPASCALSQSTSGDSWSIDALQLDRCVYECF